MLEVKVSERTQASIFKGIPEKDAIPVIGRLCQQDMKRSGILASVSAAQFILESGYGTTELAQNANNCFGMKTNLSNNRWSGSTWDGVSKYTKQTKEEYREGEIVVITADFRKYPCIEDSVADHSAYLLGAMRGNAKRYAGLQGEKNYRKAVKIIKDGGYATDSKYVDKICNIIERWGLTQFDVEAVEPQPDVEKSEAMYYVQTVGYVEKRDAEKQLNKIKATGFDAFIKKLDNIYRVQAGAFSIREKAEEQFERVKGAGFDVFINLNATALDILAMEVIKGRWGTGLNRKIRLTQAGYDYNAIQNRVNQLM